MIKRSNKKESVATGASDQSVMDQVGKDYRDALKRLIQGMQTHRELKGRRVRINPTNVALEARRSRNPLYTTHKDVLKEIQDAASRPVVKPAVTTAEEKVSELREINGKLTEDNRKLVSENAKLLYRAVTAEKKLIQKDREIAELMKKLEHVPVPINRPRKIK